MDESVAHVLVVEDDMLSQLVAADILEQSNCKVDTAASEKEALEKTNTILYDLILMDIGLGESNGFEVTKKIKNGSKNLTTPVIALTAHNTPDDHLQAKAVGMAGFLTKPLNEEKIIPLLLQYVPRK